MCVCVCVNNTFGLYVALQASTFVFIPFLYAKTVSHFIFKCELIPFNV